MWGSRKDPFTGGRDFHPGLERARIARVFPKGTDPRIDSYSGFFDNGHRRATEQSPADFLADMKLDVVAVAAGLLHDVVEDTLTTPERIAELFGKEIAHVVEGVTKIGAIPFSSSEERQAENFRKMLLAMVDDIRVILVKLADQRRLGGIDGRHEAAPP